MRKLVMTLAALAGLALLSPAAQAQDVPADTTLILRLASIDALVADGVYLAELVGQGAIAQQAPGFLQAIKAQYGGKGLAGFDTARPFGAYGKLGPNLIDSELVVLLPVVDEDSVLKLLKSQNIEPKKGADSVYELQAPGSPFPGYFRFENKYAYITARDKKSIDKTKLIAPEKLLVPGQIGMMSATVLLEGIPAELKKTILGQAELRFADLKDKKVPGESEAQQQLRKAALDELFAEFKAILTEGKDATVRVDVDRKAGDLSLHAGFAPRAGSPLAGKIADLAKVQSLGAALVTPGAAAAWSVHLEVPADVRKQLGAWADDLSKQIGQSLPADQKPFVGRYLESLLPTIKAGVLDGGASLIGPDAQGRYTMVGGMRLQDGLGVEKALLDIAKALPAEARDKLQLKVGREKIGSVTVHSFKPDNQDPDAAKLLGDTTVYATFREDSVLFAIGDKALSALKEALAATPKAGAIFQADVSVARVIPLMKAPEQKAAEAAAKKVFKEKGSDQVRIRLEGGNALKLQVTVKAVILEFLAQVNVSAKAERQ